MFNSKEFQSASMNYFRTIVGFMKPKAKTLRNLETDLIEMHTLTKKIIEVYFNLITLSINYIGIYFFTNEGNVENYRKKRRKRQRNDAKRASKKDSRRKKLYI